MNYFPRTTIQWARFAIFPFKVYVVVAFPLACILPEIDGRHGWNLSILKVLPGYLMSFLIFLASSWVKRRLGDQRGSHQEFLWALIALFICFGPWFRW